MDIEAKRQAMHALNPALLANDFFVGSTVFTSFNTGETILSRSDKGGHVYFILAGRVKVLNYSVRGKEIWHGELGTAEPFGELAALCRTERTASIVASEPTQTACLTSTQFLDCVREDQSVSMWLIRHLAGRLKTSSDMVYSLVGQKLSQRICLELLQLTEPPCEDCPHQHHSIAPKPNLTAVGKRLNTDRENVSRVVSALIEKDVLQREEDRFIVLDIDYLRDAAQI